MFNSSFLYHIIHTFNRLNLSWPFKPGFNRLNLSWPFKPGFNRLNLSWPSMPGVRLIQKKAWIQTDLSCHCVRNTNFEDRSEKIEADQGRVDLYYMINSLKCIKLKMCLHTISRHRIFFVKYSSQLEELQLLKCGRQHTCFHMCETVTEN